MVGTAQHNRPVLLQSLVTASRDISATRSRTAKTRLLAAALRVAEPDEVETVVSYLSGELRQRRIGVGWRSLQQLPPPADAPTLTVREAHEAFEEMAAVSGAGSQSGRSRLVADLFGRATADEQRYLALLVMGELRQGALDGVMLAAVAEASGVPDAVVRRAVMLRGAAGPVAAVALTEGAAGLERFRLRVGQPVRPMLASSAADVDAALLKTGAEGQPVAVEWKVDGIRVQVHRDAERVWVFTRSLDEITARVPEIVEAVLALPAASVVLDGEAVALDGTGRARPFQETGSRTASSANVADLRARVPLTTYFFDLLHLDGTDLLDLPAEQRQQRLAALVPQPRRMPRVVTADTATARTFFADAVAAGHEGVVVKRLTDPYEAGRRGAGWVKVKPRHTLDLVVLAAEWGHGRRQGWLSNLHLGARGDTGDFVMLGKTFKGLTDAMLSWQTERLLTLETGRDGHAVHVRPELVVEVAFDGVQHSPRYPAGMALRFARVLRHREDKTAAEADTVGTVRAIHTGDAPPTDV
ncbi:MAG: ATP-dependent DNA ligase [Actinomycetota bacterium]|nr:ATP-dependent DNA ligase [Actinomycetota bacterium]